MAYHELHVEIDHEDGMYWAHIKELPGCFASGLTLGELTEALESNVALYLTPTADELDFEDVDPDETKKDVTAAEQEADEDDDEPWPAVDYDEDDGDGLEYGRTVVPVKLHILEMTLRLAAERPLIPALNADTDDPLPLPPLKRDPHHKWMFRNFHRRGDQAPRGPSDQ